MPRACCRHSKASCFGSRHGAFGPNVSHEDTVATAIALDPSLSAVRRARVLKQVAPDQQRPASHPAPGGVERARNRRKW